MSQKTINIDNTVTDKGNKIADGFNLPRKNPKMNKILNIQNFE